MTLDEYARAWLEHHGLRPRTRETYDSVLRLDILPAFGLIPFSKITPGRAPKSYRTLRAILNTAVADEVIFENPCQLRGAGSEHAEERPRPSISEVTAAADAMPERLRLAVLLAPWCSLRRGELLGLERRDIDLLHGTLAVKRSANWSKGGLVVDPPKTEAGIRTLSIPPNILGAVEDHFDRFVRSELEAPVLTGEKGERIRPSTLADAWKKAAMSIGWPERRMHDLRHSGATWAAIAGAMPKELVRRVGHASPAAALRYQHATDHRDLVLAHALADLETAAQITPIASGWRDSCGMKSATISGVELSQASGLQEREYPQRDWVGTGSRTGSLESSGYEG